ncbi:MAG: sigma-70 family RNA polymerase sigma factor [Candidatus Marinimicrobia bacterium]|nr:sigma-70 family RNA polymerase sigma factor [Candidatus Neomarinimicrobiota bacterium]
MQNAIAISTPATMKIRNQRITDIVTDARIWLLDSVVSLVPRYEDAEDIVQDVLSQFTGSYDQIRDLETSSAWLYRATRNKISDFYRKRSRTVEGSHSRSQDGPDTGTYLLEEILADTEPTPERRHDLDILEKRLEAAIESLPELQREVFIWHEIDGLSFKEITEITGEPQNTLLSRKRYAVLALREKLKDLYNK